jgi:putative Holliday junction resolvase
MRTLGLDVGSKTIGLAVGDTVDGVATPLEVLERAGHAADAAVVLERAQTREVETLVVGLPLELDGREGHRARRVRKFLSVLQSAAGSMDVVTWDERYSSAAAERSLAQMDASAAKRKRLVDALAAQVILQGWLDHRRAHAEAQP